MNKERWLFTSMIAFVGLVIATWIFLVFPEKSLAQTILLLASIAEGSALGAYITKEVSPKKIAIFSIKDPDDVIRLEQLRQKANAKDEAEVVKRALALLEIALDGFAKGDDLQLHNPLSHQITTIENPFPYLT